MRLVVYTDAREFAGAEQAAATLLGALGPHVDATVLGVDRDVVAAIAAARPGAASRVVPAVRGKRDLAAVRAHVRAVRDVAPDIFQANLRTTWSCQYGILAALRYGDARLVAFEHAPLAPSSRLQRALKRRLASRFSAHVAASAFSARRVEELAGLPVGAAQVVPCGVGDEPDTPEPARRSGHVVAGVGRLVPEKGFDILVRALPSLPGVSLVLIGDGPERKRLEVLAGNLGVGDRLQIDGWQRDFRRRLAGFDLVVSPSRFEAFGIANVEAMLARRAVVASRVGGIPEVVADGETGLLVAPDDPVSLAAAVRRLLADRPLRESLGDRGRARALDRYRPEAAALAFEDIYEEILTRPARARPRAFLPGRASIRPGWARASR